MIDVTSSKYITERVGNTENGKQNLLLYYALTLHPAVRPRKADGALTNDDHVGESTGKLHSKNSHVLSPFENVYLHYSSKLLSHCPGD